MKHIKTIIGFLFLFLKLGGLQAQESLAASGGEATAVGGVVSYSIGQMIYTSATGINGSVALGVQQPCEILTITGINETNINLMLSIYPNPTTNYLILKTLDSNNISYQLYNFEGKIIDSKIVIDNLSKICLVEQPKGTYFLNIVHNNHIMRIFKVIKN
jgi:hypothetical protein